MPDMIGQEHLCLQIGRFVCRRLTVPSDKKQIYCLTGLRAVEVFNRSHETKIRYLQGCVPFWRL